MGVLLVVTSVVFGMLLMARVMKESLVELDWLSLALFLGPWPTLVAFWGMCIGWFADDGPPSRLHSVLVRVSLVCATTGVLSTTMPYLIASVWYCLRISHQIQAGAVHG